MWKRKNTTNWVACDETPLLSRATAYACHVLGVVGVAIGAGFIDFHRLNENRSVIGIIIVLFSAGVSLGPHMLLDRRNAMYERRRADHITHFNDNLEGILAPLLKFSFSKKDHIDADAFIEEVLGAGVNLFFERGIRLCVYRLENSEETLEGKAPVVFLQLVASRGRQDIPRLNFTPGTEAADHAIAIASGHVVRAFDAIDNDDPRFDRREGSVWSSYMQFPLRVKSKSVGSLMVDSREPIRWTQEHQAIGQTIATLLSRALEALPQATMDLTAALEILNPYLNGLPNPRYYHGKPRKDENDG